MNIWKNYLATLNHWSLLKLVTALLEYLDLEVTKLTSLQIKVATPGKDFSWF